MQLDITSYIVYQGIFFCNLIFSCALKKKRSAE